MAHPPHRGLSMILRFRCNSWHSRANQGTKNQPKVFQIRDILATPCLEQQKKATCISFCPGYPDVWVPDVPGLSCPRTLPLGCFLLPDTCGIWGGLWRFTVSRDFCASSCARIFWGVFMSDMLLVRGCCCELPAQSQSNRPG